MKKKYYIELTLRSKNEDSHTEYETDNLESIIRDLEEKVKDLKNGSIINFPEDDLTESK